MKNEKNIGSMDMDIMSSIYVENHLFMTERTFLPSAAKNNVHIFKSGNI